MKNLNAEDLQCLLALYDCGQAREWAEGKSLDEAWKTCHRGDWMLWLAARYGDVPLKTIVAIACDAVEPALAFTTDPRPTQTIAVVRRWLKDEATIEEVRAAAYAAAYAADAAAYAARAASLLFSADICRKYIEIDIDNEREEQ